MHYYENFKVTADGAILLIQTDLEFIDEQILRYKLESNDDLNEIEMN